MITRVSAPVLRIRGADVVDLLQRVTTNDMTPLGSGKDVVTLFTTEKGRIAEAAHVCPLNEHQNYVFVMFGCHQGDFTEWLSRYIIMEDAQFDPEPVSRSHWVVFNPDFSISALSPENQESLLKNGFLGVNESYRGKQWSRIVDLDGEDRSGHLLEELVHVTSTEFENFDVARIRAGIPLASKELTDSFNPMEALLREHISFTKGCYVGQEVIARLDSYRKVSKALGRVQGTGRGMTGSISADGKECGVVTSVAQVGADEWAGLAYVKEFALTANSLTMSESQNRLTLVDHNMFSESYGVPHA